MGRLRVRIEQESCQSSSRCVRAAPDAFALDEDHLATPLPGSARLSDDELLAVARGCPALAIVLLDEQGRELDL